MLAFLRSRHTHQKMMHNQYQINYINTRKQHGKITLRYINGSMRSALNKHIFTCEDE